MPSAGDTVAGYRLDELIGVGGSRCPVFLGDAPPPAPGGGAGINVTADGTLLITDSGNDQVYAVGRDGVLRVVAGVD